MSREWKFLIVTWIILGLAVMAALGYFVGYKKGKQKTAGSSSQGQSAGLPNDNVYFSVSADGKSWSSGNIVIKKASVPDLIKLEKDVGSYKKDDYLVYFVDFDVSSLKPGSETLGFVVSHDQGKNWGKKQTANIKNKVNKGAAVDPSIVQLPDGTLRLYFFGSEVTSGDPAQAEGAHKVYSAKSTDGLNFTVEDGVRFSADGLTDPEVIFYKNKWFMYYSVGTKTELATSDDGLSFKGEKIAGGDVGGVPGAVVTDGQVRIYGCGKQLASALSSDGINFTKDVEDIFNGQVQGVVCDPSVIKTADGKYPMVYKVRAD